MTRWEWFDLGVTVLGANYLSHQLGITTFGNRAKYNNHWAAYGFVKS